MGGLTDQRVAAIGKDKSKGEGLFAFRTHLVNKRAVTTAFIPNDLGVEAARLYVATIPDMLAYPYSCLPSTLDSNLRQFTEFIASIIAALQGCSVITQPR